MARDVTLAESYYEAAARGAAALDAFDSCVYRTHAYNGLRTNSPALWSWELWER